MSIAKLEKRYKLQDLLNESCNLLSSFGIDNPRLEVELIISNIANIDRLGLLFDRDRAIGEDEREEIISCIKRRCNREPLQYLLNRVEFYGYQLLARSGVFIPRPESEFLVEEGVRIASRLKEKKEDIKIIDLCTGSGCVAVTLAKEIPYSMVYATDISPLSIEVSSENAGRLEVLDRTEFFIGDLFEPMKKKLPPRSVDLIVSNPPYVPSCDLDSLPPEVKNYEPRLALDGGIDGLDFIKRIIEGSAAFLSDNGCLLLEIGIGQAGMIKDFISRRSSSQSIEFRSDYAGIERIAIIHG